MKQWLEQGEEAAHLAIVFLPHYSKVYLPQEEDERWKEGLSEEELALRNPFALLLPPHQSEAAENKTAAAIKLPLDVVQRGAEAVLQWLLVRLSALSLSLSLSLSLAL